MEGRARNATQKGNSLIGNGQARQNKASTKERPALQGNPAHERVCCPEKLLTPSSRPVESARQGRTDSLKAGGSFDCTRGTEKIRVNLGILKTREWRGEAGSQISTIEEQSGKALISFSEQGRMETTG